MFVKKARDYFIGKNVKKRLNCAQSVMMAFKYDFNIDDEVINNFKLYGSGNAPYGLCGAYYATRILLETKYQEEIKNFEKYFMDLAGDVKCKEIKLKKNLSCIDCVEKCAVFLQNKYRNY